MERMYIMRNRKICEFEALFFVMNALLFIFSWLVLGLGYRLTGSKIVANMNTSEFEKVRDSMIVFNTAMFILLLSLSMCGMKFAIDRFSQKKFTICYGIVLFFFVTIPLLAEGSLLLEINEIDASKVEDLCSKHREQIKKEVSSPFARQLFLLAHRFDTISQEALDN